MIRSKYLEELVRTYNHAVSIVRSWIIGIGLEFADYKTDVLRVDSRKKLEFITIIVSKHRITKKRSIIYSGVMIDNRLRFRKHLTYVI